jgi:hypothetical protein
VVGIREMKLYSFVFVTRPILNNSVVLFINKKNIACGLMVAGLLQSRRGKIARLKRMRKKYSVGRP